MQRVTVCIHKLLHHDFNYSFNETKVLILK